MNKRANHEMNEWMHFLLGKVKAFGGEGWGARDDGHPVPPSEQLSPSSVVAAGCLQLPRCRESGPQERPAPLPWEAREAS